MSRDTINMHIFKFLRMSCCLTLLNCRNFLRKLGQSGPKTLQKLVRLKGPENTVPGAMCMYT